jgi:hypothetical protein
VSGRASVEASSGVSVRARTEWRAGVRVRASVEARASVSIRASDEKNQRSSVRSRSHSHSDFVPCRIDLSNFLDDLIKIKNIKVPIKNMSP